MQVFLLVAFNSMLYQIFYKLKTKLLFIKHVQRHVIILLHLFWLFNFSKMNMFFLICCLLKPLFKENSSLQGFIVY